MKAEIIDDWDGLPPLEEGWDDLLRRSRSDCIFLTWEWIQAWRAVVGDAVRPFVVVVRNGDEGLAGIAPLYTTRSILGRVLPYRTLRVLGDDQSGSEYQDWILREDREEAAAQAIGQALAAQGGRWDCLWVPRVAGWTGARERILTACAREGFFCRERARQFSGFDLPSDYATYLRTLSGNTRSTIQRRTKQVFGSGEATFEQCRSEGERAAYLEALFELNHRRWSAAGQAGTFVRKPLEARFYREFTRSALERGWLRLWAIRTAGEFKAVQIGYVYRRTFHQLQEGFDPAGPSGIGNVLRARVIEECIKEGVRSYDFLGEHTEHKRRWAAVPRTGYDLFVGRRSLKTAIVFGAGVWPTGRYLRPARLAQ